MTDFGDLTDDDVPATEPADAEQAAIILHRLRRDEGLDDGLDWDEQNVMLQVVLVRIAEGFLERLRREGSNF